MNEPTNSHRYDADRASSQHGNRPYWRRAHRDWRFWVGAFVVFAAMVIFVVRYSLVLLPRSPSDQPLSGAASK